MNRREFIGASVAGLSALALEPSALARTAITKKTHIVTLSFDDGFKKSFFETADIYERHGLRGCFNVIAVGGEPQYNSKGLYGNFTDWNELKRRGHEVMAHTYDHTDLTTLPLAEGKAAIDKCADYFETHLDGFQASKSVYNFAYNASNAELDAYALTKFLVVRTQGQLAVNPIPTAQKPVRIGCWSYGPTNCDAFLDDSLRTFFASPGGWFVFNTHGLDDEGWGPISAKYLNRLLTRLKSMPQVEILPAGEVVLRLT